MTLKVGINGYGRIGRNVLRALYESGRQKEIRIVAVNDLGDAETNAHLTRFDTVHGRFRGEVQVDGDHMVINGDRIRVLAERDPSKLPWGELGVDTVFECTGPVHQQGEGGPARCRRREACDHFGAGREGRRRHHRLRRKSQGFEGWQ
jgi:glyceraldehyde 3-phosphate dehydrogenase